jgi:hypothetical protein
MHCHKIGNVGPFGRNRGRDNQPLHLTADALSVSGSSSPTEAARQVSEVVRRGGTTGGEAALTHKPTPTKPTEGRTIAVSGDVPLDPRLLDALLQFTKIEINSRL